MNQKDAAAAVAANFSGHTSNTVTKNLCQGVQYGAMVRRSEGNRWEEV